ncbi:polar amino acid transport system substrate-binding protein [Lachnospiraceae bacterium XBB1006]|nr:polar amino acid transport system substrate-binding protein [Lachnospiraceae bacterium XBB1006]
MENRLGRGLLLGALVVTLLCSVMGCENQQNTENKQDTSLQKILDSGTLVLGLDNGFPPMGFLTREGRLEGFDIDVAQEVCNRMGIKLEKQPIDWKSKEIALNNRIIDCIWNGMSITPERAENMTLSEPYMKNELIFVVPGESTAKGITDLKGKKVGVQVGSTAKADLEKKNLDVKIVPYEDNLQLLEGLRIRSVDAVLIDSVVAYYFVFSNEETYYVLPESLGEEEYAIGFRKGDKSLRDQIQKILGMMKEDGTLGEISTKWFGSDITIVK